jgi:dihydrofolate reductase
MIISMIVVMDLNGGIGKDNKIPWRLQTDLRRFRSLTMGHHLVMGRKTFLSIGKPLPGRINIVLSRDPTFQVEGCHIVNSLDQALGIARNNNEREVFIIGGADIYTQSLPITDRIYLTIVHTKSSVDVYFPNLNKSEWVTISTQFYPADDNNDYPTTYKILERCSKEPTASGDPSVNLPPQSP